MPNIFDLFNKIKTTESDSARSALPVTHIVAGLGNPGDKYTQTRHNAGFMCIDYISQKLNFRVSRARFNSLCGEAVISEKRILFLKPQTYMNNSGEAVREAADFYKIKPENIIAISDDINLDCGIIRVKRRGSDGGQKGLRSIGEHLNTSDFPRIKIGVGMPPPEWDLADWVLGAIPVSERESVFKCIEAALPCVELIAAGDIDGAMGRYN